MSSTLNRLREDLANREIVFRAPPFDQNLVNAIRLISPQFVLRADETSRKFWERNQNGACWGEFDALEPLLRTLPVPNRVLEVGPGLGRSAVFLTKKMDWRSSTFHLYEGDGTTTRYTLMGARGNDSFCGNLALLRDMLEYNQIGNYEILDAAKPTNALALLPYTYDLIYSFYSVGFHWSLEHFLPDLLPRLNEGGVGVFTVPLEFEAFTGLERVNHRMVRVRCAWPSTRELQLLIVGKRDLAWV